MASCLVRYSTSMDFHCLHWKDKRCDEYLQQSGCYEPSTGCTRITRLMNCLSMWEDEAWESSLRLWRCMVMWHSRRHGEVCMTGSSHHASSHWIVFINSRLELFYWSSWCSDKSVTLWLGWLYALKLILNLHDILIQWDAPLGVWVNLLNVRL